MAAYCQDLRERVLCGLERGEGATAIARRLEVSVRWVYQVKDAMKATASVVRTDWGATGGRGLPSWKGAFGGGSRSRWT
jgi:hypothetical protein